MKTIRAVLSFAFACVLLVLGIATAFAQNTKLARPNFVIINADDLGFGGAAMPSTNSITGKTIEDILSVKGQANDGMFKVVIGRTTTLPCGCEMGKEMGVNTWAAFAGADENALVDGDFAVEENQLQPVLKSLRHDGINIVAIHSHMTQENPRILFLHYWGRGKAESLARSLKKTLDLQNAVK